MSDEDVPDLSLYGRWPSLPDHRVADRLSSINLLELLPASDREVDEARLYEDLRRAFTRQVRNAGHLAGLPPGEKRRRLERLERKTKELLDTLDETHPEAWCDIANAFENSRIDTSTDEGLNARFTLLDPNDHRTRFVGELSILLRAMRRALDIPAPPSVGRPPKNRPLENLIEDLASTYQSHTGKSPSSGCYYAASIDSYTGPFFGFVRALIVAMVPSLFHSDVALGKAIQRALKDW